jgi:diguanylate cyclase (GGDEF)-like protein
LPLGIGMLSSELAAAFAAIRKAQVPAAAPSTQDETTGAYRRSYLYKLLEEEVERGRRSKRSFTVCLVGLDDWRKTSEDLGPAEAQQRLRSAITSVSASKRLLDKVVDLGDGEVLLVLAETPLGGAETVAWRLRGQFSELLSPSVRVGIAEFPRDAVTESGLMEQVQQALAFARTANIPVVDRSLLSTEQVSPVG